MIIPPRSFFARDAIEVAPNLLGAQITTSWGGETVTIRITETECYHGRGTGEIHDAGSHARMGRTARNASMFGEPGHLYVYFIYGLYSSVNLVCSPAGQASGVLLRAGEVIAGEEVAFQRRPKAAKARDLARGPGRLAMALGLKHPIHDGLDFLSPDGDVQVRVLASPLAAHSPGVSRGPRVGVSGEAGGPDFPWRFWLTGDPSVSAYRPGKLRS